MKKNQMKKTLSYFQQLPYKIITQPVSDEGDTYWIAEYPDLRGCKTEGETEIEAITNVQELFDEYIEARLEVDDDIPVPSQIKEEPKIIWLIQPEPPVEATSKISRTPTCNTDVQNYEDLRIPV